MLTKIKTTLLMISIIAFFSAAKPLEQGNSFTLYTDLAVENNLIVSANVTATSDVGYEDFDGAIAGYGGTAGGVIGYNDDEIDIDITLASAASGWIYIYDGDSNTLVTSIQIVRNQLSYNYLYDGDIPTSGILIYLEGNPL